MSRTPRHDRTWDDLINLLLTCFVCAAAVMAAASMATIFQTIPTAIDPMTSVEARYER
ncbi:hypothetical protein [Brevundimonas sp.]|uniref:hypothetical protein n=1 Tax=Brevundimonas sp. TaxID=1871086 RepID=UPI0028A28921|nr:hypothetical protein [Brevundimonas sp.]